MLKSTELLSKIYQELYNQKAVLPEAPALTLTPEAQTPDTLNVEIAQKESSAIVAYLLGKPDIEKESWETLLDLINQYYETQPEWKKMLLDFLEYRLQKEAEEIQGQQEKVLSEIQNLLNKQA